MSADEFPQPEQAGAIHSAGPRGESPADLEDPRVVEALEEYLAAVEAGARPNRKVFLARHAEIALALAGCLDAMEALQETPSSQPRSIGEAGLVGTSLEWQPEAPLGDFRIVREIGRGGMGVVYEAVQMSLGRRVALKVLPFAAALDAKHLQRFRNEAQAAANLHHTHIVPVYAVGTERGVHFYAMQLIDGRNLAALIEELRRERETRRQGDKETRRQGDGETGKARRTTATHSLSQFGSVSLSPCLLVSLSPCLASSSFFRTAAGMAVQAAQGLDYAHGIGIIHRDIKPANLLVDAHGNVWITDFGLAQFHADANLTQTGDLLGTLRYMSPEQAGGERTLLDHRTDVYSLGATLYELLTLRPIFDGADRQILLNQILNAEPRPPRSVNKAIPPELETIVLKAIAKIPAERYATAQELADDLQRFLEDRPIRARRATLAQRGRKWLRRHPSVLVAGAVMLVLLAAGSLASAWLVRGAYQQERKRASEAERQFLLARRAVDDMIQMAQENPAHDPQVQALRKRLLEAALSYYQEFIEQHRDDPRAAGLEATHERVRHIIADLAVLHGSWQHLLLGEPAVQDDLELAANQRHRINEVLKDIHDRRSEALRDSDLLTAQERSERLVEEVKSHEAAIVAILTPDQHRRLRQIGVQCRGPAAFREPEVQAALDLTPEQGERIHAIELDMFSREPDYQGPPFPADAPRAAPEQTEKAVMDKILALLTQEQSKRWQELIGKPFLGPRTMFLPGGPRRFGPPPE